MTTKESGGSGEKIRSLRISHYASRLFTFHLDQGQKSCSPTNSPGAHSANPVPMNTAPSEETEREFREFLDGIVFSPGGKSLVPEEGLPLEPNSLARMMILPSPSGETEGELGDFLDGILF